VPCPSLLLMLLHTPMEQVIDIDYVNEAMKRMEKGDVHFRFVIDINKSLIL
jgi:D-arabinose 1-dehydrogenase-like Zn-dependent alcohol dehydrogenase